MQTVDNLLHIMHKQKYCFSSELSQKDNENKFGSDSASYFVHRLHSFLVYGYVRGLRIHLFIILY